MLAVESSSRLHVDKYACLYVGSNAQSFRLNGSVVASDAVQKFRVQILLAEDFFYLFFQRALQTVAATVAP